MKKNMKKIFILILNIFFINNSFSIEYLDAFSKKDYTILNIKY